MTGLQLAAVTGHVDIVKLLIENDATVDMICGDITRTPLLLAVDNSNEEVAKYLAQHGADPSHTVRPDGGNSPILKAAHKGLIELIKFFVTAKLGILNVISGNNTNTLLHEAASGNQLDTVKYLHTEGLKVDAANAFGDTPLHKAAAHGHINIVKWLIEKGADFNQVNVEGFTPRALASLNAHKTIVDYFRSPQHIFRKICTSVRPRKSHPEKVLYTSKNENNPKVSFPMLNHQGSKQ